MDAIRQEVGEARFDSGHFGKARELFDAMIRSQDLVEFLTLPAYDEL